MPPDASGRRAHDIAVPKMAIRATIFDASAAATLHPCERGRAPPPRIDPFGARGIEKREGRRARDETEKRTTSTLTDHTPGWRAVLRHRLRGAARHDAVNINSATELKDLSLGIYATGGPTVGVDVLISSSHDGKLARPLRSSPDDRRTLHE